jgi:hypothetical protein
MHDEAGRTGATVIVDQPWCERAEAAAEHDEVDVEEVDGRGEPDPR